MQQEDFNNLKRRLLTREIKFYRNEPSKIKKIMIKHSVLEKIDCLLKIEMENELKKLIKDKKNV